jgi:hypothetical protein
LLEQLDQDANAGRLAHARAAADDRHPAAHGRGDGAPLLGLEPELMRLLGVGERRLELRGLIQRRLLV